MTQARGPYRKIGLTGGIGSGKSTAARRFAALGARVYHADEVSRRALDPGAACYDRVVSAFGPEILRADGSIDRRRLAEIVFSSEERRQTLNAIVHPHVIGALLSQAERDFADGSGGIAVFEVPLLFESGMDRSMDHTIVVSCDEETRIRRVAERDGLTREDALSRMRAQMPEEEKLLHADFVLENNGTEEALLRQVDALYEALTVEGARA
ncbi:MAG TPA: dephospho-CoA kinase [Spirochaetota bacterium]|nr:dephospho-CoA kinase [Spirochaetota bacterium]